MIGHIHARKRVKPAEKTNLKRCNDVHEKSYIFYNKCMPSFQRIIFIIANDQMQIVIIVHSFELECNSKTVDSTPEIFIYGELSSTGM